MEELWKSFLAIFLGRCLLSLEARKRGDRGRQSQLSTHGSRKALLGLAGDGGESSNDAEKAAPAELVVQPNFEIVFLSPSHRAEAVLGRYCERTGREVGVLFRITRRSCRGLQRQGSMPLSCSASLHGDPGIRCRRMWSMKSTVDEWKLGHAREASLAARSVDPITMPNFMEKFFRVAACRSGANEETASLTITVL